MRNKNSEYIAAIEGFIKSYKESKHASPTVREIESGTGISRATVGRYLDFMRKEGMLEYSGHRSIVMKSEEINTSPRIRVPILGAVSCGVPKLAEENIEEIVELPASLFGSGSFYMLRANGDSMTEAGIDNGDLVVIKQQDYASPGQIVVALTEDEATLKRFYPEPSKKRIRLHPANSAMEDIYVDSCIIQGIAVKVLKNLG